MNQKHITSTNGFLHLHIDLPICKSLNLHRPQIQSQIMCHLLRETLHQTPSTKFTSIRIAHWIGRSREQLQSTERKLRGSCCLRTLHQTLFFPSREIQNRFSIGSHMYSIRRPSSRRISSIHRYPQLRYLSASDAQTPDAPSGPCGI